MRFLCVLLLMAGCVAFPKSRRHAQHGSADPTGARGARRAQRVGATLQNTRNVRQTNRAANRVDTFGTVNAGPSPSTHEQGAIEVMGGIVNIAGGMVNAVGGVVNVVGARINYISARVQPTNPQGYGVRTGGRHSGGSARKIGTLSLTENPGIVNTNDSTVTIVGGTVNLFEGYSVNDPDLPPPFMSSKQTTTPTGTTPAVDAQPQATAVNSTTAATPTTPVPTATTTTTTTTPPPTTTTTTTTTTTPPPTTTTTTPEPTTTLSALDALFREGCEDAFARAEVPVTSTGFGPLDDNCGTFVKCVNMSGKIVTTLSTCPDTQWFSNATGACAVPDGDVCPWSPCVGATTLFVADPNTCFGYYECEGGSAQFGRCPPGYFFSNRTNQCHQDILDSCSQANPIPPGELLDYLADLVEAGLVGQPMKRPGAPAPTGTTAGGNGAV